MQETIQCLCSLKHLSTHDIHSTTFVVCMGQILNLSNQSEMVNTDWWFYFHLWVYSIIEGVDRGYQSPGSRPIYSWFPPPLLPVPTILTPGSRPFKFFCLFYPIFLTLCSRLHHSWFPPTLSTRSLYISSI